MPTYSYRCTECESAFDIQQAFTDDTLTVCPVCAGVLRKVFSPIGVSFSGSGFYRNDSRAAQKGESKGESKGDSKGESKGESKSDSKGESKSDAKSESGSGSKSDSGSGSKSDSGSGSKSDSGSGSKSDSTPTAAKTEKSAAPANSPSTSKSPSS